VALFQEFVDMPVNGRPSLFRIDSVHQIETSPTLCWSINTMVCADWVPVARRRVGGRDQRDPLVSAPAHRGDTAVRVPDR
jgi:hypothetical protein